MQEQSQEIIASMATKTVKDMTMEKMFRQIGDEVIEYTAAEYAQYKIDQAEDKVRAEAEAAKAADKAALLLKLGITADEAKLLLQ
jgi:hypothetical protein